MKITHVIRGEEHLSNTPYQLMLIDALGYERPIAYAHMPLILAHDGAKLSKRRHPEANLILFREQGYLPEALLNYLPLLGWTPSWRGACSHSFRTSMWQPSSARFPRSRRGCTSSRRRSTIWTTCGAIPLRRSSSQTRRSACGRRSTR